MPAAHGFDKASECDGKTGYETKGADKLRARQPITNSTRPGRMRAYRCTWCGLYHIGHRLTAASWRASG